MEEKKAGKRLAQDGSAPRKSRRGLIAVSAVLAALIVVYLALCVWVSASGSTLPRTTAAGLDVSGLTREQLQSELETGLTALYEGQSLRFTVEGVDGTYEIDGSVVSPDVPAAADGAWTLRQGGFLSGGWRLLRALALGNRVEVPVSFTSQGEAEVDALLSGLESELGGQVLETTWEVSGDALVFHMGEPGRAFDMAAVKADILDRFARQDFSDFQISPAITDPAPVDAQAIHTQLYALAQNATLDRETYEVVPSVTGIDFEPSAVQEALEGAQWGEELSVPITVTEPTVTTEALQESLFRDVLGEATTNVSGSSNRKSNVKLSASVCNGIILLPGDVFSYNDTTGSRTADKGYLPAPSYVGGKSTDEIGGGICQTSSTIYYAALLSNLKIVERANHMYDTGYIPLGMDATVWYGSTDFRFENDTDYPIKLVTSYQNSRLTVQIYGTKVDDTYVKMTNKVLSSTPWETEYKVDPSLPAGSTKTEQTPYTGYVAEAYRNIYSGDGELISSTLESKNTYRSRNKIVLVSPADAANYGLSTDGLPLPSPDPATVESPAAESPVPSETAEAPAESPAASESPAPSETAEAPADSPAVSESPAPSDTAEAPADSSAVSESPTPSETPAESPEAASTQVPDIGIPISSAALEDMAEAAEGGDR